MNSSCDSVLVHLASGIGNIVLATPLLIVLARHGYVVDILLDADYLGVGELMEGWSVVRTIFMMTGMQSQQTPTTRESLRRSHPFIGGGTRDATLGNGHTVRLTDSSSATNKPIILTSLARLVATPHHLLATSFR